MIKLRVGFLELYQWARCFLRRIVGGFLSIDLNGVPCVEIEPALKLEDEVGLDMENILHNYQFCFLQTRLATLGGDRKRASLGL